MQENNNNDQPSWYIDEGIPGQGQRPDWLSDKFKSAADLAKSYSELEKKFSQMPEEYDFSKSRYLDPEFDSMKDFLKYARDKRVPKDVIDKMVDSVDQYMNQFQVNVEAEKKKLGDNADDRLKLLDNWAKANLSDGSYAALTKNLNNADTILALEELRGKMMSNNTMIPNGNDSAINAPVKLEDVKAELSANLDKYKKDPAYRADLQSRLAMAAKSSQFVDKIGF